MSAPTTAPPRDTSPHDGEHTTSPRWRTRLVGLSPWLVTAALLFAASMLLGDFQLSLLARFLALAILAVGLDVAWGYGGMLSLGHGVFFGLGGYGMAMHMKLDASPGLPDFMQWSDVTSMPWWWAPFTSPVFTVVAILVVPAVAAGLMGWMVFHNRIRGAYFAILTQALVLIFVTVLVSQQGYTGGTNGITNLSSVFGLNLYAPETGRYLYWATAIGLLVALGTGMALVRSRFGRLLVACRDGEDRVRFLGYDPTWVKTLAFAFSGALAGLAGALYVPVVGIIAPGMIGVVPSIQMVIWVALGGRATLFGPALGAVLFGFAQTTFAESFPSTWLYLQGALLIVVLTVAPRGLAGVAHLAGRARAAIKTRRRGEVTA